MHGMIMDLWNESLLPPQLYHVAIFYDTYIFELLHKHINFLLTHSSDFFKQCMIL